QMGAHNPASLCRPFPKAQPAGRSPRPHFSLDNRLLRHYASCHSVEVSLTKPLEDLPNPPTASLRLLLGNVRHRSPSPKQETWRNPRDNRQESSHEPTLSLQLVACRSRS